MAALRGWLVIRIFRAIKRVAKPLFLLLESKYHEVLRQIDLTQKGATRLGQHILQIIMHEIVVNQQQSLNPGLLGYLASLGGRRMTKVFPSCLMQQDICLRGQANDFLRWSCIARISNDLSSSMHFDP
jgi:hypothetical protein